MTMSDLVATSTLLTVREVAQRLYVDPSTVRRWIQFGALEAITLPHRGQRENYRIKAATLEALLVEQTLGTVPQKQERTGRWPS